MECLFTQKNSGFKKNSIFFLFTILLTLGVLKSYAQQPRQRVYANTVEKSNDQYLLLIRAGYVENQNNAVSGSTDDYAVLNSTIVNVLGIKLGGEAWVNLKFTGTDKPTAGTPVTVKLGVGGNVLSVLSGLTVQATNGGNPVGSARTITDLLTLLNGEQQIEFTVTPTQAYDGVRVKLGAPENSLLAVGALTSTRVYHAYFTKAADGLDCDTPVDVLYGNTGILASALNAVENPTNAIDNDPNTVALLRANVGVLNQTYLTAAYPSLSKNGDSIRVILRNQNTGLLDLNLLSQNLRIRTFNDNNLAEDLQLNTSLLRLNLLGGSSNVQVLTYPTTSAFNRIQVSIGDGVAMALGGIYIHEIDRKAPNPVIQSPGLTNGSLTACIGAPININIAQAESGASYKWFDSTGTEITAGVTNNGTSFTPTGLAVGDHTFYVAVYRNGCTNPASERSQINITINAGATAADISAAGTAICVGDKATLNSPGLTPGSTIINPVFTWYFDANKTQAITNGTVNGGASHTINPDGSLTVSGLSSSRNYYISVSGDGICENPAGSLKEVSITVNSTPQPVIDLAGNQTIGTGGSITLTATAAGATSFEWFKDGVLIPGQNASTLTISNATAADAGLYSAIAYGVGSCASLTSATVNLQVGGFGTTKTVEGLNANGKIDSGKELTYKITITNTGSTTLDNITVTDPIPTGTVYVTNSVDNNGVFDNGNNTISWNNLSVSPNSNLTVSFKVKVADDLTSITAIGNKATVNVPGETPQEPEVLPIPTEQTSSFIANKSVSGLNADNKIQADTTLTYTISVQNTGNTVLNNITIVDPIPAGTSYIANSADNGGIEDGGAIKWTINVGVGETKEVKFQVLVASDLTNFPSIANIATVTNPANPDNPEIVDTPPIPTERERSFTTAKTDNLVAGAKLKSGDIITYSITITNTGSITLDNMSIVDPIPAGTTYITGSASDNATFSSNTLEWNVNVAVGTPKTVTFQVRVNDDLTGVSKIRNRATVTDPENPTTPETPETPDTDTEQVTSYDVAKTLVNGLNSNNRIEPGAELTYNISVINKGNILLDEISIEDILPNGTTYVEGSADNGGTLNGNKLQWTIDVPVGSTPKTVAFKVKVNEDLTGIPSIANTATITDETNPTNPAEENPKTAATPGYDTEQNSSFEVTSVITSADASGKATPNTDLTVTISVKNTGNTALTNVNIENLLPAYTSYVSGGNYNNQTSIITASIPNIAIGATENISFVIRTNGNLDNVTAINNVAVITANSVSKTSIASLEVICNGGVVSSISVVGNNNGNICINGSGNVEITVTSSLTSPTYFLYEGNTLVESNSTGLFTVPVSAGNSYTFSGAVAANGYCETAAANRKNVSFTVNSLPATPTVASTSISVCEGTPATLSVTNPQTGITYNWYNSSGNLQGSGSSITTGNINSNESYQVEAVSASGCTSARVTINVTVQTAPAGPASVSIVNGPVCLGTPANLRVNNPAPGVIYRWYTDLTGGTLLSEGETFTTQNINSNTTIYVEAVSQSTSCVSTSRTAVDIEIAQQLGMPVASLESKTSNSITFGWTAVANAQGYEVSIDGGNTWITPSSGSNSTTHTVSGLKPAQEVSFTVRAKGVNDCQTSANANIINSTTDNPLGNEVFIPNTFTPNNDGQNDYFMIYGNTINSVNMRVFNQWGQLIFHSTQLNAAWDGTYKGQAQPTAVYVYQIEITFKDGSKTNKRGTVTLIR